MDTFSLFPFSQDTLDAGRTVAHHTLQTSPDVIQGNAKAGKTTVQLYEAFFRRALIFKSISYK